MAIVQIWTANYGNDWPGYRRPAWGREEKTGVIELPGLPGIGPSYSGIAHGGGLIVSGVSGDCKKIQAAI